MLFVERGAKGRRQAEVLSTCCVSEYSYCIGPD